MAQRLDVPADGVRAVVLGSALHEAISQALGWWAVSGGDEHPSLVVVNALESFEKLATMRD